jgi:hypothetical protein
MTKKEKYEESERFVAQHYERGAFSEAAAWRRMGLQVRRPSRWRMVAAASVLAVLTVSACIYYFKAKFSEPQVVAPTTQQAVQTAPQSAPIAATESKVIDFDNAELVDVVLQIEKTYGVKVVNVPTEDYRLTLHYEGTASDLVDTINDILDINLAIEE